LLRIENAKSEAKVQVHETGQSAVTHYKVLNTKQLLLKNSEIQKVDTIRISVSLVECRIETGRTHQIRVHMAHI
jgi:23S rRNA pseudouridine1911/1915/1917 synthase